MKIRLLFIIMIVSMFSLMINNDAYGCSRDETLDYVLAWKHIYLEPTCETQLAISWIGFFVWIIMGFLLYNFAMALLNKKTMWQRK